MNHLWNRVSYCIQSELSYHLLIIGEKNLAENNTISLIMYCIYKKFISDNSTKTYDLDFIMFTKKELRIKANVLEHIDVKSPILNPNDIAHCLI